MDHKKSGASTQELLLMLALISMAPATHASIEKPTAPPSPIQTQKSDKPKWLLKSFLDMAQRDPAHLISIGDKLFSSERLRITAVEPGLAHEWQHRLAMSSALSELFIKESTSKNSNLISLRIKARKILAKALSDDPSLLVRDGTVESLRRIFKMNPAEAKNWKSPLEKAFLSEKNVLDGEGFFIRETILTAMKEGSIAYSRELMIAGAKDKNQEVQSLIKAQSKHSQAAVKKSRSSRKIKH